MGDTLVTCVLKVLYGQSIKLSMKLSISHELANFIDYGNRLLRRLKVDGQELSKMEMRILAAQLRELSTAVKQLDESKAGDRNKDAA